MDDKKRIQPSDESIEAVRRQVESKKKQAKTRKRKRGIVRIFRVLLLIGAVVGLYFLDKSSITRLETIKIEGNNTFSKQEIMDNFGLEPGSRMLTKLPFIMQLKANNIEGIESVSSKVYFTQNLIVVTVTEENVFGYIEGDMPKLLYADGTQRDVMPEQKSVLSGLPRFSGFDENSLTSKVFETFGNLDSEIIMSISEVQFTPDKYDNTAMRLIMNNNYYVYTSLETLPLMKSYASIIGKADPSARCIYLSEYGPTENTNMATVRQCE